MSDFAEGEEWLAALPGVLAEFIERWGLEPDGDEQMSGYLGVVVLVRRGAERLALKISRPTSETANQLAALRAWGGRGMVRLVAADEARGALLMERLSPHQTLDTLPLTDAVEAAARLLRRLSLPGIEAESGLPVQALPTLRELVADWPVRWRAEAAALGDPLPARILGAAIEACSALGPDAGSLLVDHDLHYLNVLAAEREPWLAVDPRGVVGDPQFALGPLMWNRFEAGGTADRLARYVDVAGLDMGLARGWLLVRAVDFFLWSTGAGFTYDPAACREISEWLVN